MHILKNYALYLLIPIIFLVWGIKQIVPTIQELRTNFQTQTELEPQVEELQNQIKSFRESQSKKQKQIGTKPFYKNAFAFSDPISSFVPMFEEIISYAKVGGLRVNSIEYKLFPPDDIIVKNLKDSYDVCKIEMVLIGDYNQFRDFLNQLYHFPYVLTFNNIETYPFKKDKSILISKIAVCLYIKK